MFLTKIQKLVYNHKTMKIQKKEEVVEFLKKNKQIISKYGVKRIGIFGSFIHDTQIDSSDIDILVEFDASQLNYTNFINLAFYFEDNLERRIDLVTTDSLSPYIGPRILEEVEFVSLQ